MIRNIQYLLLVFGVAILFINSDSYAEDFWEGQTLGMQEQPVPWQDVVEESVVKTPPKASKTKYVKLRITNKTTANSEEIIFQPNRLMQYQGLEILIKGCWVEDEEYNPEHAVLIDIYEADESNKKQLFSGWLFANKHTITTLEHPYFDVTMVKCLPEDFDGKADIKEGVE